MGCELSFWQNMAVLLWKFIKARQTSLNLERYKDNFLDISNAHCNRKKLEVVVGCDLSLWQRKVIY